MAGPSRMIGYAIFLVLFAVAAYFIHQSSTCFKGNAKCQAVSDATQNFLFAFPVFMVVYEAVMLVVTMLGTGSSITGLFLQNPAASIAVMIAIFLTAVVWAIMVLQYSASLRSCGCEATAAENVTYSLAVLEIVVATLAVFALGYAGVKYALMSPGDRKEIMLILGAALENAKRK